MLASTFPYVKPLIHFHWNHIDESTAKYGQKYTDTPTIYFIETSKKKLSSNTLFSSTQEIQHLTFYTMHGICMNAAIPVFTFELLQHNLHQHNQVKLPGFLSAAPLSSVAHRTRQTWQNNVEAAYGMSAAWPR